ncbi:hypothetical protein [Ralstonia syzygii]|uniref:hypothetical protein n=1 Tax=Ralstonia syzygii TaxID=28097 RepID=UPI00399D61A4
MAACQGIGVSVAAVALEHRLNANLLRHWIDQAEVTASRTYQTDVAGLVCAWEPAVIALR